MREPSNAEVLMCVALLMVCIAMLAAMWCGLLDEFVRWVVIWTARMR